jgi:hypothetical protein
MEVQSWSLAFLTHDAIRQKRACCNASINDAADSGIESITVLSDSPLHAKMLHILGTSAMLDGAFHVTQRDHVSVRDTDRGVGHAVVWKVGHGVAFRHSESPGELVVGRITSLYLVGSANAIVLLVDVLGIPVSPHSSLCPTVNAVPLLYSHMVILADATLVRIMPSPTPSLLWVFPLRKY